VKNKQRRLPATTCSVINLPRSGAAVCIAFSSQSVHSTQWSQILAETRDFCLPHLHSTAPLGRSRSEYCHDVWWRKTGTVWLTEGENKFEDTFIRFYRIQERDGRTDGRKSRNGRPRLCRASLRKTAEQRTIIGLQQYGDW